MLKRWNDTYPVFISIICLLILTVLIAGLHLNVTSAIHDPNDSFHSTYDSGFNTCTENSRVFNNNFSSGHFNTCTYIYPF